MGRKISYSLVIVYNTILWEKEDKRRFTIAELIQGKAYSLIEIHPNNFPNHFPVNIHVGYGKQMLTKKEYDNLLVALDQFCQKNNWELIHFHEPRGEMVRRTLLE